MMATTETKFIGKAAEAGTGILFVEDTEDDFVIACYELRKLNIASRAVCVSSVEDMIAYMSGAGVYHDREQYPFPAVVVLDLRFLRRGGMEAQAWLRSKLKYRHIPIILTSSPDMVTLLESAVRLGANAYMTKPFKGDEFRRLILEHRLPVQFATDHAPKA
jgi:CheY-like chemotaxis protein